MDGFAGQPPTDIAVYVFFALSRIYFTSSHPIDFFKGIPQERLLSHAKFESFKARKLLFDLYLYCQKSSKQKLNVFKRNSRIIKK